MKVAAVVQIEGGRSARTEAAIAVETASRDSRRLVPVGIALLVAATLCAVAMVPENVAELGALRFSGILMLLGLGGLPVAIAIRDPKAVLRGEFVALVSPIFWLLLDLIQDAYMMADVRQGEVQFSFAAISCFGVGVWVSCWGKAWSLPGVVVRAADVDFSPAEVLRAAWLAFGLAMLNFAIPCNFNVFEMFYYLGQPRWLAPWGRGALGGWDAFRDQLAYFGYLLPSLMVVIAMRVGWVHRYTVLSGVLSLIVAAFLSQGGGRRIIGVMVCSALIVYLLRQDRVRVRSSVLVVVALAGTVWVLQTMLSFRNEGFAVAMDRTRATELRSEWNDHFHVDDNFLRLTQMIQLIPAKYDHVYWRYVVWAAVRPIPRVFWPGKPTDPGFDLPSALGAQGVSYSSSVIGELYMSAGFLGILAGGWFYGRVGTMLNGLRDGEWTVGKLVIFSAGLMALFTGMRSILELVLMNYVVVSWVAVTILIRWLKGSRKSVH